MKRSNGNNPKQRTARELTEDLCALFGLPLPPEGVVFDYELTEISLSFGGFGGDEDFTPSWAYPDSHWLRGTR